MDFAASLLGYTDRLWLGFSVDHLLRPNYGLYNNEARWPIKFSAFGGYQVVKKGRLLNPIDETLSLAFHFRKQYDVSLGKAILFTAIPAVILSGVWIGAIYLFYRVI